jgi:hypothetical protein
MRMATRMQSNELTEYLHSLKVGDSINRQFLGAGLVTDDEPVVVEKIDTFLGVLWINGADGEYDFNSFYAYSLLTGRDINHVTGFVHQIVKP